MMICISSIDAHTLICTFQTHGLFHWTSILDGGPTLKQHRMFAGRRVSCRPYICLYSSMCEGE